MPDTAQLLYAIKEHLSPEAVALIAAKCQPICARGEAGRAAEAECAWFAQQLIEMLGSHEHEVICKGLEI